MEKIFLDFLNRSIVAGWMILAVILLRLLLKRVPKWIHCLLWGMAAVRLACPFSLESVFSLIPSKETVRQAADISAGTMVDSGIRIVDNVVNPVIQKSVTNSSPVSVEVSVDPLRTWMFIGSVVWIVGAIVLLLYAFGSYIRLWRRVRTAVRLEGRIMESEFVDTPFLFGLFRPRIYLPSGMSEELRNPVTAHELAHLRRHDNLWKIVAYILLALYWFHPLCWAAYFLFCRDVELACDESVIKEYNMHQKKVYSEALLACSQDKRAALVCPLAFGEVGVRKRIQSVLNYKKPAFWVMAVAVATCVAVAVCFMTDPVKGEEGSGNLASAGAGNSGIGSRLESGKDEGNSSLTKDDSEEAESSGAGGESDTGDSRDDGSEDSEDYDGEQDAEPAVLPEAVDPLDRFMKMDWNEIRSRDLHVIRGGLDGGTNILCIGELPEADIKIYGYRDEECYGKGVAVEIGSDVNYFDWTYTSPHAIFPDCYWNEADRQLQVALAIYTGTGYGAQELHVLQYNDAGVLTDNTLEISDYWSLLQERIDFTFDKETGCLTLFDIRNKKELIFVEIEEDKVEGLELGNISHFLLGDTIWLVLDPGYYGESYATAEYPGEMPVLEAELILLDSQGEIQFELGEIRISE